MKVPASPIKKSRGSVFSVSKKSIWPELVGLPGMEARRHIKDQVPVVSAQIVELGDMITEDYLPERVQIFVDDDGIVTWPPQIG
jgi:hypothetical protein